MKKSVIILIIILLFYLLIYFMSRDLEPQFLLGTGWKYYEKERKLEQKAILIGEIKEKEVIFIKNIKIYPKISGLLSYDLKKIITKLDQSKPLTTDINFISRNREGKVYVVVEYEIIESSFVNYLFNLPIRIERVKIENPLRFIQSYIE